MFQKFQFSKEIFLRIPPLQTRDQIFVRIPPLQNPKSGLKGGVNEVNPPDTQFLRNPTTPEGCKNLSRGLGCTLWVSRRSTWIRAFERTSFHDHPTHRSEKFCEKLIFMQKNTVSYTFLNLAFLIRKV